MEAWEVALRIVLLGLSAIMWVISLQAWRRNRGRRMFWVMASFLGFFVLSLLVLVGMMYGGGSWSVPNILVLLLTIIIGANYLALLKGLITVNDALDLESRRTIYEMVRSRPGTYLREMERELGMQVGMLTYHLRVLAEAGMIRAEQEGNHLRYFPADGFVLNDRRALSHLRNRTSRAILIHVLDRGSAGFSEILGLVGVSKSTLSYHLKRLAAAGLVTLKKGEVMSISAVDPERLVNLLVWVREDLERDSADALVDVWNRLNER